VEEHGVDLDHEGEGGVGDVLVVHHRDGEADDYEGVVDQQLVGRPFPVVDDHVCCVVDEVPDGEGHQGMGGRSEGSDQVVTHLRVLIEKKRSPHPSNKRMN